MERKQNKINRAAKQAQIEDNKMKNYQSRDKKLNKKKNGMKVSGRSLFLINFLIQKKALEIRLEDESKLSQLESDDVNKKIIPKK